MWRQARLYSPFTLLLYELILSLVDQIAVKRPSLLHSSPYRFPLSPMRAPLYQFIENSLTQNFWSVLGRFLSDFCSFNHLSELFPTQLFIDRTHQSLSWLTNSDHVFRLNYLMLEQGIWQPLLCHSTGPLLGHPCRAPALDPSNILS